MAKDEKEKIEEQEKPSETPVEFLASLASVLVTGLFIITFILQAFEIPSSSMEDTLLIGDHLFVNRVQFAPATKWLPKLLPYREPHRGDIIVFLSPATPGMFLVKRVVGVPGDRLHLVNGKLFRNGEELSESYVMHKRPESYNPYRDEFPRVPASELYQATAEWGAEMSKYIQNGEIVVPPGKYFAMGDNRDVSYDSRYWGFVPRENLVGRPMFIYWSFKTPDDQYLRRDASDRIGFLLHTILHFFDETRWNRTLKVVK